MRLHVYVEMDVEVDTWIDTILGKKVNAVLLRSWVVVVIPAVDLPGGGVRYESVHMRDQKNA